MEPMELVAWLIIGGVAGWLASTMIPSGLGVISDIVVGMIGGFMSGFMFQAVGEVGMIGLILWSVFVASIGSVAVCRHSFG